MKSARPILSQIREQIKTLQEKANNEYKWLQKHLDAADYEQRYSAYLALECKLMAVERRLSRLTRESKINIAMEEIYVPHR